MDAEFKAKLQEEAKLMLLVHGQEIAMKLVIKEINRTQDVTQKRILQVKLNMLKEGQQS